MLAQSGSPVPERRASSERRLSLERRLLDRRSGETPQPPATGERRLSDRRSGGDRRASVERRLSLQSADDQIRGALKLLTVVADGSVLGEQQRRSLEAAMLRLRFALERIEES